MPAIVSLTFRAAGFGALAAMAMGGNGVSLEANQVRDVARVVVDHAELAQSLFPARASAIARLTALVTECKQPNWDGCGAAAVNEDAVARTIRLLRAMPDNVPVPDFAVDPDGAISVDWIRSRNHLFSVSIGHTNRLAFAWLDGTDSGHGVARFDGLNIPRRILEGIEAVSETGHAALRAS